MEAPRGMGLKGCGGMFSRKIYVGNPCFDSLAMQD